MGRGRSGGRSIGQTQTRGVHQRPPAGPPRHALTRLTRTGAARPASGPVMARFIGPPRLPVPWRSLLLLLDGHRVWGFLTGPAPDLDIVTLAPWFFFAFWIFYAYAVVTFAIDAALTLAELVTRGAAWVRALRAGFDRVTLPQMRRLANGAVIATTLVQLASRPTCAEA